MICDVHSQLNPHEFVSSGWDDTLQFWDARCPNAVRRLPGVLVCGDGIRFDRKGRDLLIASWRPDNQLQVVKDSRNLGQSFRIHTSLSISLLLDKRNKAKPRVSSTAEPI